MAYKPNYGLQRADRNRADFSTTNASLRRSTIRQPLPDVWNAWRVCSTTPIESARPVPTTPGTDLAARTWFTGSSATCRNHARSFGLHLKDVCRAIRNRPDGSSR